MKKGLILLCLLLPFALASVPAGDAAYDQGDYETAITEYKAAFEADANNIEALVNLARANTVFAGTMGGDEAVSFYEQGEAYARQAIELNPDYAEGYFELARALGRLAQFRGILESINLAGAVKSELERTLELDPDHGGAMHALALWHLEVPWLVGGRSDQVIPLFEQAIAVEPDAITHYVDFGEALIRLNDEDAARAQLEAALAIPATTYGEQKDHEKAQALLGGL